MHRNTFRFAVLLSVLFSFVTSHASESADSVVKVNYRPNVHGTLRGRLDIATEEGEYRFQLRNARVSLDGRVAPFIDYFLNVDLCDAGKMKFLDGWARIEPVKGLKIKGGQFRMPFGIEPHLAPHQYYFANRSFIAKQMCNYRAVGAEISYNVPLTGLNLTAGAFSPTTIGDHSPWNKSLAFSGKATYKTGGFTLSSGYMTIEPDSVRSNLADVAVGYSAGRWSAGAEYIYKSYTHSSHKSTHGYATFASYAMPVKSKIVNRASFQTRFDGMTDASSLKRDDSGKLVTNYPERQRLTLGATISYFYKPTMYAELRANYEQMFYRDGYEPSASDGNRFVLEFVVRF